MKEAKSGICTFALYMFCLMALLAGSVEANAEPDVVIPENVYLPESLQPQLSADQKIVHTAQPVKVFIADPNPPAATEYIPPPAWVSERLSDARTAAFQISYVAGGDTDLWGAPCQSFPSAARDVLNTAANIWASVLRSRAPITIRACWGDLGVDSGILGYSGGGPVIRDFSRAPRANTWYPSSLANALYGRDLISSEFDMHITFSIDLPGVYHWNFSTDGNVDSDEFDLLTVALHEICHGLGFFGSMNGSSSWGLEGYPLIYDVFTRDTYGTPLIEFEGSNTYTLADALTIGQVFFHGPNAMAANDGKRVELFTPVDWMPGSSYSHLSMNYNHTDDKLMVYMLSLGNAIHYPGPVIRGLLKDIGWPETTVGPPSPPAPPDSPSAAEEFLPYMMLLL